LPTPGPPLPPVDQPVHNGRRYGYRDIVRRLRHVSRSLNHGELDTTAQQDAFFHFYTTRNLARMLAMGSSSISAAEIGISVAHARTIRLLLAAHLDRRFDRTRRKSAKPRLIIFPYTHTVTDRLAIPAVLNNDELKSLIPSYILRMVGPPVVGYIYNHKNCASTVAGGQPTIAHHLNSHHATGSTSTTSSGHNTQARSTAAKGTISGHWPLMTRAISGHSGPLVANFRK